MTKVLLLGGSGLVGSALSKSFLDYGMKLKITSRRPISHSNEIDWEYLDMSTGVFKNLELIQNIDTIVYNAACIKRGESKEELEELHAVNVSFAKDFLVKACQKGFKKLIYTSGLNFIKKPLPDIIHEDSEVEALTPYAITKLEAEKIIIELAKEYGFKYYILRLTSPIAENLSLMPDTVIKKWIHRAINGNFIQIYGSGNRAQDFVSLQDVAQAYIDCIENDLPSGIYNIASGDFISMNSLALLICSRFGVGYEHIGVDKNANDIWNVSIEKAKEHLKYAPKYNSTSTINNLINNLLKSENRHS